MIVWLCGIMAMVILLGVVSVGQLAAVSATTAMILSGMVLLLVVVGLLAIAGRDTDG